MKLPSERWVLYPPCSAAAGRCTWGQRWLLELKSDPGFVYFVKSLESRPILVRASSQQGLFSRVYPRPLLGPGLPSGRLHVRRASPAGPAAPARLPAAIPVLLSDPAETSGAVALDNRLSLPFPGLGGSGPGGGQDFDPRGPFYIFSLNCPLVVSFQMQVYWWKVSGFRPLTFFPKTLFLRLGKSFADHCAPLARRHL